MNFRKHEGPEVLSHHPSWGLCYQVVEHIQITDVYLSSGETEAVLQTEVLTVIHESDYSDGKIFFR